MIRLFFDSLEYNNKFELKKWVFNRIYNFNIVLLILIFLSYVLLKFVPRQINFFTIILTVYYVVVLNLILIVLSIIITAFYKKLKPHAEYISKLYMCFLILTVLLHIFFTSLFI